VEITGEQALTVVVLAVIGYRLASGVRHAARREGRELIAETVRGVRWRHVWPAPLVMIGVVAVATALMQIPGLSWGWWSAIGGTGNPVTGSTAQTVGTVWEWLIPAVFLTMLIPALPLFAYAEERMFRERAQRWSTRRRAWMVVKFGLVHALIGIPIGVAIALSVGGLYFMTVYLRCHRRTASEREATLESTRAHTAYNALIIAAALLVVLLTALGS
jgi:hypothetical protein